MVRDGHVLLGRGAHENGARPSVDVLFRSAALSFGRRTVAVVLSSSRDDGVAGASAVRKRGGCVFVQSPDDAAFPSMPSAALARDHPDRVLPLAGLAAGVTAAVRRLSEEAPMSENGKEEMNLETEYATIDADAPRSETPSGEPSGYGCPACGGVLWELNDDALLRYRCRVGHAYTAEGAVEAQRESIEAALWTALRALQERAQLSERLAARVGGAGANRSQARFEAFAREAREQADAIRRLLAGNGSGSDG